MFLFVLTVSVYIDLATIGLAYLAWYTEMEWYLIREILIDINQCVYIRKFTCNLFPRVSNNHFPMA